MRYIRSSEISDVGVEKKQKSNAYIYVRHRNLFGKVVKEGWALNYMISRASIVELPDGYVVENGVLYKKDYVSIGGDSYYLERHFDSFEEAKSYAIRLLEDLNDLQFIPWL